MRIAPPAKVTMRRHQSPFQGSLALRYGAAWCCTLIAIAAAQLEISNALAETLVAVTLLGLPLSLLLRRSRLRFGPVHVPRPLINSMIVVGAGVATTLYISARLSKLGVGIMSPDFFHVLLIRQSATESVELLMDAFLIFAVARSLAIITDKDAVHCAYPSFSVMLLLIVVHQGQEMVAYFLLWTVAAAVLFAVDHRAELQETVGGYLPPLCPGQDVQLAARSLATVLAFSLVCSVGLAYSLSAREGEDSNSAEAWLSSLAGQLTQAVLGHSGTSVNVGPERQIDYSVGPALPSRAPLWDVRAFAWGDRPHPIQPFYWRMFTLGNYNGKLWSQIAQHTRSLQFRRLHPADIPLRIGGRGWGRRAGLRRGSRFMQLPGYGPVYGYVDEQGVPARPPGPVANPAGPPLVRVLQSVASRADSVGFVPVVPTVHVVRLPSLQNRDDREHAVVRLRRDEALDVPVLHAGDQALIASYVMPSEEYGLARVTDSQRRRWLNPAIQLSGEDTQLYLKLPQQLPASVARLARNVLARHPRATDNFARARYLAREVSTRSYTLRPPGLPQGEDAVAFFLFESRRGYCTHFAGALTVLCRIAGIPARLVSGFVSPEWSNFRQFTVLRESNLHAWTEVWEPGWGWMVMDATPADDRGQNSMTWWQTWADQFSTTGNGLQHWALNHKPQAVLLAAVAACLFALVMLSRGTLWLRLRLWGRIYKRDANLHRRVVEHAYGRMATALARRYRPRAPWETRQEWLQSAIDTLLLERPEPLQQLTDLYLRVTYDSHQPGDNEGVLAQQASRRVSWRRQHPLPAAQAPLSGG